MYLTPSWLQMTFNISVGEKLHRSSTFSLFLEDFFYAKKLL